MVTSPPQPEAVHVVCNPAGTGMRNGNPLRNLATCLAMTTSLLAWTQQAPATRQWKDGTVSISSAGAVVDVQAVLPNAIRVHVRAQGSASSDRTLVMDPTFRPAAQARMVRRGTGFQLRAGGIAASLQDQDGDAQSLTFTDRQGKELLTILDAAGNGAKQAVAARHAAGETLYGMRGTERFLEEPTFTRTAGAEVKAGVQGDGGAPLFFTTRYGVLIDSDGGAFTTQNDVVRFTGSSRKDVEFFVIAGAPKEVMGAVATLTGKAPMPPKWTLGFMNSQYISDESEIKTIVSTYREKRIPIDGIILDFDWKAWGEDNYGEWRWNSTTGPGASAPDKFPDGVSGDFAKTMAAKGIKLGGILKPRIIVPSPTDPNAKMVAAQYAIDHGYGYPNEPLDVDYVTHKTAMNIDFNNGGARKWFWEHLRPAYQAGIVAWWNDEADLSAKIIFNNFQHVNMGRMLYEGQRGDAAAAGHPLAANRVWSLNRNYYLGGLRYGYGMWSGDIRTGFDMMAAQREHMVASLNLGAAQWSMDTGGYSGHPEPENYARWVEFAAFVPIFRVHGGKNQKRQPWVYGPVAEAAAKSAIELRYSLMPYLYSGADEMHRTGIGLARPMFWEFPDDANVAEMSSEWMFGNSLLVSPVVTKGATTQSVYLPAGEWTDYRKGTKYAGGQTLAYPVDAAAWTDIPVFVKAGSIVATQPPQQYVGASPVTEIALDIFPGPGVASFNIYDDDGTDYAYERGSFFRQAVTAKSVNGTVLVTFGKHEGTYAPAIKTYRVRVHAAGPVRIGQRKAVGVPGTDRFGQYREAVVPVN